MSSRFTHYECILEGIWVFGGSRKIYLIVGTFSSSAIKYIIFWHAGQLVFRCFLLFWRCTVIWIILDFTKKFALKRHKVISCEAETQTWYQTRQMCWRTSVYGKFSAFQLMTSSFEHTTSHIIYVILSACWAKQLEIGRVKPWRSRGGGIGSRRFPRCASHCVSV